MSKNDEIQQKLISFVTRNFMVDADEIILDESLIDQGIIDSLGLVEITSFIEREYGIVIEEDQMTRANFGSVYKMVDFIIKSL